MYTYIILNISTKVMVEKKSNFIIIRISWIIILKNRYGEWTVDR
jgi:hypothetical protein